MLFAVLIFGFIIYAYYRTDDPMRKLRGVSVGGMIGLNFILNLHIYPNLLTFQSSSEAGKYIHEMNIASQVYNDGSGDASLCFYAKRVIPIFNIDTIANTKHSFYLYCNEKTLETLFQRNFTNIAIVKKFEEFPVTHLRLNFLNTDTRVHA